MIVDSSAIISILKREPDAGMLEDLLAGADSLAMSSATLLEAAIVVDSQRDPVASGQFDKLIARAEIAIEPFTEEQSRIARQAYRDYGKGSGHPANLNFGDCFAYALAKVNQESLLFKGDDFNHTDIESALVP